MDLQLHPNPANERVRVTLNKPTSEGAYRVVDLNGRALRQGQFTGATLDLYVRDLPTGTYVFHYNDGTGGLSRRFTVTK